MGAKPPAAPLGNKLAQKHGGHSNPPPALDEARQDIYDTLAAAAPVKHVADTFALEVAARALARYRALDNWIAEKGALNKRGDPRSATRHLLRAENQLMKALDALGMTPRSRAALGLDIARSISLAEAMSEPDPTKRAQMLDQLGLTEED